MSTKPQLVTHKRIVTTKPTNEEDRAHYFVWDYQCIRLKAVVTIGCCRRMTEACQAWQA